MKNWKINKIDVDIESYVNHISHSMQLSPEFTRIYLKRLYRYYPSIFDEAQKESKKLFAKVDSFLNPSLQKLLNPSFLPNMEKAGERVLNAIKNKEKILIWGDYDVDGITATTICIDLFKFHGYEVQSHLPQREEGYGLNQESLARYIDEGLNLLITVDCGISDFDVINFAREKNVDTIVTDHHILPENLPPAYAILNPYLCKFDSGFDFMSYDEQDLALCGAGVAFFFMCHMNNLLAQLSGKKCDMREMLDLVALATIADMVPLRGLNRILVKAGLVKLGESKRLGIQALKEVAGYLRNQKLSTGQVSFSIAPRINAVGRMSEARIALELLLSTDYNHAIKLAKELDTKNSERKSEEETIIFEATQQAENYGNDFSLVLANDSWNQGIIGIVASRMVEKYYKPTLILTQTEDPTYYKGSGRSTSEIDLYDALCTCKDDLDSFGGHRKAAGLRIRADKIEDFRKNFNAYVAGKLNNTMALPTVRIDESLQFLQSAEPTFLKEIALLEPFGIGNSEPNFMTSNVTIKGINRFGFEKKHIQLKLYDGISDKLMHAKLWNTEDFPYKENDTIQIAYSVEIEQYKGIPQVNMKIKDIKNV